MFGKISAPIMSENVPLFTDMGSSANNLPGSQERDTTWQDPWRGRRSPPIPLQGCNPKDHITATAPPCKELGTE